MTQPNYNRNQRVSKWGSKPRNRSYYEIQRQIVDLETNDNLRDYLREYVGLNQIPQSLDPLQEPSYVENQGHVTAQSGDTQRRTA